MSTERVSCRCHCIQLRPTKVFQEHKMLTNIEQEFGLGCRRIVPFTTSPFCPLLKIRTVDRRQFSFGPNNYRLHFACLKKGPQTVEECQLLPTLFVFCHLNHVLSPLLSAKMRLAGETFCRESTSSNASKLAAAGRCFPSLGMPKGNYDWTAIADGRYYVEWYVGGTRRRVSAGVTAAQALEVQRRKHHELEGRKLGIPGFQTAGETVKKPALHVAITKYLEQIEALKKPNTHRKYEAVLNRFGEFFRDCVSIDAISGDDLTRFVVTLKKDHGLGSNTILHNAVIVAQFLKRHGRSGITKELSLPERITPLVKIYRHEDLARFFAACSDAERALFATFLLTGFREQEAMFLRWSDINFELRTVRVTSKPELGFYPKRWEDREIPAPVELIDELQKHTHRPNCQFVFPSPTGNREQHMLDHCKSIAKRAKLDPTKFDLKTFRSTYATGMLRRGFDVRTVQHWMGHKSLKTTMRYLAPATDVHDALDLVTIPSVGKAAPAPRKSAARETRSLRC